jgi:hypothetical protein
MTSRLGGVEQIGDGAENDDETGAEKRHDGDHDDGENGEDEGVFYQCLSPAADASSHEPRGEEMKEGGHGRRLKKIRFLHQEDNFDNERYGRVVTAGEHRQEEFERMELLKP